MFFQRGRDQSVQRQTERRQRGQASGVRYAPVRAPSGARPDHQQHDQGQCAESPPPGQRQEIHVVRMRGLDAHARPPLPGVGAGETRGFLPESAGARAQERALAPHMDGRIPHRPARIGVPEIAPSDGLQFVPCLGHARTARPGGDQQARQGGGGQHHAGAFPAATEQPPRSQQRQRHGDDVTAPPLSQQHHDDRPSGQQPDPRALPAAGEPTPVRQPCGPSAVNHAEPDMADMAGGVVGVRAILGKMNEAQHLPRAEQQVRGQADAERHQRHAATVGIGQAADEARHGQPEPLPRHQVRAP